MKNITLSDMTLFRCASVLSFKERIEIARHLDNLNVDVIDMPEITNLKTDTLLIRTVSAFVKRSKLSVSTGMTIEGVDNAVAALSGSNNTRLKVAIPVSPVKMEYTCHKKPQKMLALAKELFEHATGLSKDVEFFASDATRADRKFLSDMINTAAQAGVSTITICDNEASMMPDEFGEFIKSLIEENPVLKEVKLGVLCENRNSMATASALMAVKAGVDEVKCCIGSTDIPSIDVFAGIINNYGGRYSLSTDVNYTKLNRISAQIAWILSSSRSEAAEEDSSYIEGMDSESMFFDEKDSPEAITSAVKKLGYDLSEDDYQKVYEEFHRVAIKKKVGSRELDAIVASTALQVPPTYNLVSYVINTSNVVSPSAQIKLSKEGRDIEEICIGDGPIDAAFHTVEKIIGNHYELDNFQIQAVTQGTEAVGSAVVRLRSNGRIYSGNGISTDIIGASIRAYINAVNKIVYEEESI